MSACERAIEVEDLVLGLGSTEDLEEHLENCADCMDAKAMFVAERALFAARPAPAPPPLALPAPARVVPFFRHAARVIPALAGIAAGVAALVAGHPFGHLPVDCETTVPAAIAPAFDEPLTCEVHAFSSAPAPAMTLATRVVEHAPLACVASSKATCELPESVTSSLATP